MSLRRSAGVLASALLVVATAGCSSGGSGSARGPAPTEPATTQAPVPPHKTVLKARLGGRAVVPGPGASSGSGTAAITLDPVAAAVCYALVVDRIDPATGADIFTGPAGAIGPSTVVLEPPAGGKSDGCVAAERGIIESMVANPSGFYVSISNVQFPGGALRGQLSP